MFEQVIYQHQLLAIIIYAQFSKPGVHFFTPDEFSQQLAYINHPTGKTIQPHVHNFSPRQVQCTQEVLLIKKGELRVDFYSNQQQYIESRILGAGDTILLVSGGHGFEVIEEVEMMEVKQGPYFGGLDTTRFVGIEKNQSKLLEDIQR